MNEQQIAQEVKIIINKARIQALKTILEVPEVGAIELYYYYYFMEMMAKESKALVKEQLPAVIAKDLDKLGELIIEEIEKRKKA